MTDGSILVVEDDKNLCEALCDTLRMAGYDPVAAHDGEEALDKLGTNPIRMVISDVQMQPMDGFNLLQKLKSLNIDLPVILMTAYGTIEKAVQAMRLGAVDYMVKPFEADMLVNMVNRYLPTASEAGDHELIAEDPKTRKLVGLAKKVGQSQATVLITGESGTGKEVFAQFIHRHSSRAEYPFIAINCAAIPENMLESVLFGYEKGAFTGAYKSNPGKFELANNGTILLDEISEMDLALQAKLLRVLQEREVERVGGNKVINLDVRVLATTNRNLREEVAAGRFREDLFYRLNVFPLHLVPLRERQRDILPLAWNIISRQAVVPEKVTTKLSSAAEQKLVEYHWPGNVRELDNVLQRSMILCDGNQIEVHDIDLESDLSSIEHDMSDDVGSVAATAGLGGGLKAHEQSLIIEALREVHGSRKAAAERLGISPRTLRYKLARLRDAGIELPA